MSAARPIRVGAAVGLGLLALLGAAGKRAGALEIAWPLPDGPGFWLASRALGFTAYAALFLDMVLGLSTSTALGDRLFRRGAKIDLHRFMSVVALSLTALHAGALLGDKHVGFDLFDILVPGVAPYRPVAVGLGLFALYAALVVHGSFALMARIGGAAWRAVHLLSFGAFVAATAHGISAGTDSASPWAQGIYLFASSAVLWLAWLRVGQLFIGKDLRGAAAARSGGP